MTETEQTDQIVDINADLGEGAGTDEALLKVITSANIACGVHAGDPQLMATTVRLALVQKVGIGAHPSFPDREGFGRRAMTLPASQITAVVADQIAALRAITQGVGARLQHVKAHGALYNLAVFDSGLARAIGEAVQQIDPTLIIVALAGTPMVKALEGMGLRVAQEAFLDRAYTSEGTLVPREHPGAVITDGKAIAMRAVQFIREARVVAVDGTSIGVHPHTLCIHGDTPGAATLARTAIAALEEAGITVAAMETIV